MLVLLAAALSASLAGASPAPEPCVPQKVEKRAPLRLPDGKTLTVDVADTPWSRQSGLMCRRRLPRDYGMLFVFPGAGSWRFWMKRTLVPLDVVWIGEDKVVTGVRTLRASRLDTPDERVDAGDGHGRYVLELPAGTAARRGVAAGARLSFDVEPPEL